MMVERVATTDSDVVSHQTHAGISVSAAISPAPLVAASQQFLRPNGSMLGRDVAQAIRPLFPNLLETIPRNTARNALCSNDETRVPMDHDDIHEFIQGVGQDLHSIGVGRGHRIAVVLPNGPELALAILAISAWAVCVPLNAFGAEQELSADLKAAACDVVIGLAVDPTTTGNPVSSLALKLQIPFVGLQQDDVYAGRFTLVLPSYLPPSLRRPKSLGQDVTATTSTGGKKLVPHLWSDVLVATACIAVSWRLTPNDTNCNLMPLFHVGGIIRQVYSPILSGGCVICCPSFDPTIFWQLLSKRAFTWYYAAPTMHHLILQMGRSEGFLTYDTHKKASAAVKIRMIANAAGGLSPSLARELRQAFRANVLPSYGMTECMPITAPPATYQLEKPGTSGVAVGPEIAILNTSTGEHVEIGKEGPICVRGEPCFRGYGRIYGEWDANKEQPTSCFLPGGWFDTGDLGYMDADGYLYITGRSKEVINRGGEIISPLEVEEACMAHPDITAAVAFSTSHSVLQEVVGILIVPKQGCPKIDLQGLHDFLGQGRLAAPKWPQCLVYTDAVPKSHTNKLLRVKLGQRLGLPELNDSMYPVERTFEAKCPKIGTPVSVAIPCQRVKIDASAVEDVLKEALINKANPPQSNDASIEETGQKELAVIPHPDKLGHLVVYVYNINRLQVVKMAQSLLDAYTVPSHVCQLMGPIASSELSPPQPSDAILSILHEASSFGQGPVDPLVNGLQEVFQNLLDLDCLPAPDTNFFNLGGSSMLASQLASKIRKIYGVPFGGAEVFHHPTCSAIADLIRERRGETGSIANTSKSAQDKASMAASSMFSQQLNLGVKFDPTRMDGYSDWKTNLFQLVPMFVIYPLWTMSRFFLFFKSLLFALGQAPNVNNLLKFIITSVTFHFLWVLVTPLIFVAVKWIVIGKYQPGRYPLWGDYYMRWWFVDIIRKIVGLGYWGSSDGMLRTYYRMCGATIGDGARISIEAEIAEFDLVHIGDNAAIECCTMRGFCVDNGCMLLGPVAVGNRASVGIRSNVAPFTAIPDGAHLSPGATSYEINVAGDRKAMEKHLAYNRYAFPGPGYWHQTLIVSPLLFFVETCSHMPALAVFIMMIRQPWRQNRDPFETMSDMMQWLCDPRRLPFFVAIRVVRALVAPVVYMIAAVLVKRLIIGKFKPGPRDTSSQWQLCRHQLVAKLFTREKMNDFTVVVGRHYELVSVLFRALGAKIGKRVFWPGQQPIFTGEFDLLEIGDDVVFGSRSAIICSTVDSCEKVILCAGSNMADNTVVLPGSILGKNTVLGSNAVCPRNRYLPESSIWFGARCGEPVMLDKGTEENAGEPKHSLDVAENKLQMQGDDSTLRPFGRAFYHGIAPYFVLDIPEMVFITVVVKIMLKLLHTLPIMSALYLTAYILFGHSDLEEYDYYEISGKKLYATLALCILATNAVCMFLFLAVEVAGKWFFMGRRKEGSHNWDADSYAQNWEIYQLIARIRSETTVNLLDLLSGTPYMVFYFRCMGSKIGSHCCLYPSRFDLLMPEPDLVEMGDRVVMDCAHVVTHLNTRGNFELKKIVLGNNTTLRHSSRTQQGVQMETGSMLLEKALVLTGEVVEADSIWIGAPASRLSSYDTSSLGSRASMQDAAWTNANGGGDSPNGQCLEGFQIV